MKKYRDYERLICSMAWKFHNKTGIEFDEFKSEFCLVFVESTQAYEPGKGIKFSSFLCGNIVNRFANMMNHLNTLKRKNEVLVDVEPNGGCYDLMDSILIRDSFFNSKNPVILAIAEIICTYDLPRANMREWLKSKLREMDYKHQDIKEAFIVLRQTYDPQGEPI